MRKIDYIAIEAFLNAKPFRQGNTQIVVLPNVTVMKLHGNEIAYKYNDPEKTVSVSNCGWNTKTTNSRLNSIPNVTVQNKKGVLYLNNEVWDGNLIDVKQ